MKGWRGRFFVALRAGALAVGVAALFGLWLQGMHRLGFRDVYPDGFLDFLVPAVIGISFGATLGFPTRAEGLRALAGRVAATALLGIAIAVLAGLACSLLVLKLDVAERNLPPWFLGGGLLLFAVGLRRVPRSVGARVTLGAVVALLATSRLFVLWPDSAHVVTRTFFPFPSARVRTIYDEHCGPLCAGGRTRVVSFLPRVRYESRDGHLACEAGADVGLEVTRPFFVDACGAVFDTPPIVPTWVHEYQSIEACRKEHPDVHGWEMPSVRSRCCLFEVHPRNNGDHIDVSPAWSLIFHHWQWRGYMEQL